MLETRLVDTTTKGMVLESRVQYVGFRLKGAEVVAWEVKKRAKAIETTTRAAEAEVALVGTQVIEEYKKSTYLKDEVGKATYDSFQKGFAKCKKMVVEAFPGLDLTDIIVVEPKQQKEGEEEDETRVIK